MAQDEQRATRELESPARQLSLATKLQLMRELEHEIWATQWDRLFERFRKQDNRQGFPFIRARLTERAIHRLLRDFQKHASSRAANR